MPVNPSEDPRIQDLLSKYSARRDTVENYITEMEQLKGKIIQMFPDTLDHRSKFYLEEKIKASASFYATLLSLTQEYNKSIVQEIDIHRKLAMTVDGKERDLRDIIAQLENREPELVKKLSESSKETEEQIIDDICIVEELTLEEDIISGLEKSEDNGE